MKTMIDKYTTSLPQYPKVVTVRQPGAIFNVALTGSTSSLACYILERLLKVSKIGRVYYLDRSADAQKRFHSKGIMGREEGTGPAERLVLIKVDLADSSFGLEVHIFKNLLEIVDIIIHSAWKVQ
jgi:thioester reductase-like protein